VDILNLSGLEHATFASLSASLFPLIPVWAGIHAIFILRLSSFLNHSSMPFLIIFSIHWPDEGVISYAVLTTAALSMYF
jgi:hypothetical protein